MRGRSGMLRSMPRRVPAAIAWLAFGSASACAFACAPRSVQNTTDAPSVRAHSEARPATTSSASPGAAAGAERAASERPGSEQAQPNDAPRFAVVADHEEASHAALAVLAEGGSAADAAIAAMLALAVVEPASTGLGGGGVALVFEASTQATTFLDFRETAPIGVREAEVAPPVAEKLRGARVGVPGFVAGVAELHRRFGKRPLEERFVAAAELAERGFVVSAHLARALAWHRDWILAEADVRAAFAPSGEVLLAGERARMPTFAATLRRLAPQPSALYAGELADELVRTAGAHGSRLVRSDLAEYRALERTPLRIAWGGADVVTAPPPSAGGLLLVETLAMHAPAELASHGYGSGAYLHVLAETFRGAIADRVRFLGDPAFVKVDLTALVAPARMQARRARIELERTRRADRFRLEEQGTSHVIARDSEGNVACVTTSLRDTFGARVVTESGIVLNDALADFSSRRVDRRFRALRHPNLPRGGARPVTGMMPTFVVRDGAVQLALGAKGGLDAPTAVTQVLLARLAFGRTPQGSVAELRVRVPPEGGLLLPAGADAALLQDLVRRGENARADRFDLSAVSLLSVEGDGATLRIETARE